MLLSYIITTFVMKKKHTTMTKEEQIQNEFIGSKMNHIDEAVRILTRIVGKQARCYDVKIDDGVDDDETEDTYVMVACFDFEGCETTVHIYYGDVTREIGYVDIADCPTEISEQGAEDELRKRFNNENIEDRIYEFANNLFMKYVVDVENEYAVVDEKGKPAGLDSNKSEMWYDDCRDEIVQGIYDKVREFLCGKN